MQFAQHRLDLFLLILTNKISPTIKVGVNFAKRFALNRIQEGNYDLKVALQHPTAWEKVAMVSETNWITRITKFCGFFLPFPVKVFPANELAKATEWVKA